jgi:hypothetical protein
MADIVSGRCAVATNGTRAQLGGTGVSVAVKSITVTAFTNNTNPVTVGGPDVIGALATRKGVALAAGQTYRFESDEVSDLGDVWVDCVTNGEGVTFIYVTE